MRRASVRLPIHDDAPLAVLGKRLLWAIGLFGFVALVCWLGRDGYIDARDDGVSALDALYYSSVTVTGTGYGDIRPATDGARLAQTLLITPAQMLFLLLLLGTTVELLAGRGRDAIAAALWRRRLKDHVIVCGYGSKGRSAVKTLIGKGVDRRNVVVIDPRDEARRVAEGDGLASINGSATAVDVLHAADVHEAKTIVVATDRDDTSVLVTLTAREHNPRATIVAAAREEENVHLLHQSGASSVVTTSSATGRLLGLASVEPKVVEVLEDIMTIGNGIDIGEREATADEVGGSDHFSRREPVFAVIRDGEVLRFDDPEAERLEPGDRLVYLARAKRG